jgi:MerR family transcriptional regulator, light-induced transcriptional regulator
VSTSLCESIERLPGIPRMAAEEFAVSREKIVTRTNLAMEARVDLAELTGGSQISTVRDNHLNHANTMAMVFKLGSMELLAMTAPWVYRAYISHGFSPDYFPVLFGVFRDAVGSELSADAASAIFPVYDWLLENHDNILSQREKIDQVPGIRDQAREQERIDFRGALLSGDYAACISIAQTAVKSREDLASFYLQVMQPGMYEIGRMWEKGDVSVAEEHLASAVVSRVMASLYTGVASSEKTKGICIVTAAPNEYHEIGARMVADLLEQDGWDVHYLGSNAEPASVVSFVREKRPLFVALSSALPFTLEGTGRIIYMLRNDPETSEVKVMTGGQVFSNSPDLWKKLGADGYARDAAEAVKLAEEWRSRGDRRKSV